LIANRAEDRSLEARGFKIQNRVRHAALAKVIYTGIIRKAASASRLGQFAQKMVRESVC
jgi:hypothetical protein